MTFIVTHTQDHLACFTMRDGQLVQQALINTGPQELTPTELAGMGLELASRFGWELNGSAPPPNPKPELEAGKRVPWNKGKKLGEDYSAVRREAALKGVRARTGGNYPEKGRYSRLAHPDDPAPSERKRMIMAHLMDHPSSTLAEILEANGLEYSEGRKNRWQNYLWEFKTMGLVYKSGKHVVGTGARARWTLSRLGVLQARELLGLTTLVTDPIAEPPAEGVGSMPEASTQEATTTFQEEASSHV